MRTGLVIFEAELTGLSDGLGVGRAMKKRESRMIPMLST